MCYDLQEFVFIAVGIPGMCRRKSQQHGAVVSKQDELRGPAADRVHGLYVQCTRKDVC